MKIQELLLSFIEVAKNFLLTFWYNITHPFRFHFDTTYNSIKVEGKVYLFISILLYLLYYSNSHILFTQASMVYENVLEYTDTNIIRTILLTLPLYLYIVFLLWLVSLFFKKEKANQINKISFYLFSNILVLETLSFFLLALIFHLLVVFNLTNTALDLKYKGSFYISKFVQFSSFIIPTYIAFAFIIYKKEWLKIGLLLLLIASCFADNITQSFYKYEFSLFGIERKELKKKNNIEFIGLDSGKKDTLFLNLKEINADSLVMSIDVLLKNNTSDLLIYRNGSRLIQVDNYQYEKFKDNKIFNYIDYLISRNPFNKVIVDDKTIIEPKDYFILKPDAFNQLHFFIGFKLDEEGKKVITEMKQLIEEDPSTRGYNILPLYNSPFVLTLDETFGTLYPTGNFAKINTMYLHLMN